MADNGQRRHLLAKHQQTASADRRGRYPTQTEPTGQATAQVPLTTTVLRHSKAEVAEGTDRWLRRMVRVTGAALLFVGIILVASETGLLAKLTHPSRPASSGPVRASQSGLGAGARSAQNGTPVSPVSSTPTITNPRVSTFGPALPGTLGHGSAATTSTTPATSTIPPASTTTRPTTTTSTSTTTTTSSTTTTTTTAPSGTGNPPQGGGG